MSGRGGARKGAGRTPLIDSKRKKGHKIYITELVKEEVEAYGCGENFSQKVVDLLERGLKNHRNKL